MTEAEKVNFYQRNWRKAHPDKLDKQRIRQAARRANEHPEYGFIVICPDDYNGKSNADINNLMVAVKKKIIHAAGVNAGGAV